MSIAISVAAISASTATINSNSSHKNSRAQQYNIEDLYQSNFKNSKKISDVDWGYKFETSPLITIEVPEITF